MADISCPVTFEDMRTMREDSELSTDLQGVLNDQNRTIELAHSYEVELSAAEGTALLAYAKRKSLTDLSSALQQELDGFKRRHRSP